VTTAAEPLRFGIGSVRFESEGGVSVAHYWDAKFDCS
jgi:hypothetical protein